MEELPMIDTSTMITQIARFEMQKGKENQAREAFSKMAAAVKANELGCLMYAITRGQINAQEVYVYEIYTDQAAFEAHRKTDHMLEFRKAFDESMNRAAFNVEVLDEIAGFVRNPIEQMTGQM
jgi:(4S)-4-hydroxy-5-phosphonooxypentane-2,3-dione isomerase